MHMLSSVATRFSVIGTSGPLDSGGGGGTMVDPSTDYATMNCPDWRVCPLLILTSWSRYTYLGIAHRLTSLSHTHTHTHKSQEPLGRHSRLAPVTPVYPYHLYGVAYHHTGALQWPPAPPFPGLRQVALPTLPACAAQTVNTAPVMPLDSAHNGPAATNNWLLIIIHILDVTCWSHGFRYRYFEVLIMILSHAEGSFVFSCVGLSPHNLGQSPTTWARKCVKRLKTEEKSGNSRILMVLWVVLTSSAPQLVLRSYAPGHMFSSSRFPFLTFALVGGHFAPLWFLDDNSKTKGSSATKILNTFSLINFTSAVKKWSGSHQVRSPGRVTWPNIQKGLCSCHSYSCA